MTKFLILSLLLLFISQLAPAAYGQAEDVIDQRAHALFEQIRCPVCNGQSIAESDVLIAVTLRSHVLARIKDGESDDDIKRSLVERYGEDILFEPALKPRTFFLWAVPWLGAVTLLFFFWFHTKATPNEET